MNNIRIKEWFMDKNFTDNQKYAISIARDIVVEKETEKAILVIWFTDFGRIKSWIPKSVVSGSYVVNGNNVNTDETPKMEEVDKVMHNQVGDTIHIVRVCGDFGYDENGKKYLMACLKTEKSLKKYPKSMLKQLKMIKKY